MNKKRISNEYNKIFDEGHLGYDAAKTPIIGGALKKTLIAMLDFGDYLEERSTERNKPKDSPEP